MNCFEVGGDNCDNFSIFVIAMLDELTKIQFPETKTMSKQKFSIIKESLLSQA